MFQDCQHYVFSLSSVTIICHQDESMVILPSDWLVTFKPQRTQCTVGDGSFALNINCEKTNCEIFQIYTVYITDIIYTVYDVVFVAHQEVHCINLEL